MEAPSETTNEKTCSLCGLCEGDLAFGIANLADIFDSISERATDEDTQHYAKRAVTHLAHVRALYEEIRDLNDCGK